MESDFDEIIECASLEGYLIPFEVNKIHPLKQLCLTSIVAQSASNKLGNLDRVLPARIENYTTNEIYKQQEWQFTKYIMDEFLWRNEYEQSKILQFRQEIKPEMKEEKQYQQYYQDSNIQVGLKSQRQGVVSNQITSSKLQSRSISPQNYQSVYPQEKQSIVNFKYVNSNQNSKIEQTEQDKEDVNSKTFTIPSIQSNLSQQSRNFDPISHQTQLFQEPILFQQDFRKQRVDRYDQLKTARVATPSPPPDVKQIKAKGASPQPLRSKNKSPQPEVVVIQLPKDKKKWDVQVNKQKQDSKQSIPLAAHFKKLLETESLQQLNHRPFEHSRYAQMPAMVPKQNNQSTSQLYVSPKLSQQNSQNQSQQPSYQHSQIKQPPQHFNIYSQEQKQQTIIEHTESKIYDDVKPKVVHLKNQLSFKDNFSDDEQQDQQQLSQFIINQQKENKANNVEYREIFSFKPQQEQYRPSEYRPQDQQIEKQPIQIKLDIKQFMIKDQSQKNLQSPRQIQKFELDREKEKSLYLQVNYNK
ncbi:hypothetical protein pb186bvf_017864 [Paramecium bursaria]